ncbi:MAG TPA: hypothetical protein VES38_06905 [Methylotenera sp.]|nr:hypothetical protein [Methylotenera sp.]
MAGLFGSMLAGAAGKAADGRVKSIERQEEFDMQNALLDAKLDKEVQLKKMGYELDNQQAAIEDKKRAGYFNDVEETSRTPESVMQKYTDSNGIEQTVKSGGEEVKSSRAATIDDAAERALKSGDLKSAEGLLKFSPKKERTFDSIKMDDGSIFSFDKSTGTGKVILQGGGEADVPKNEIDLAWRMAGGDAKKAAEILVSQKAKIASAGRAPAKADKLDNDDLSYADWKKKPVNKDKGRDDYTKEKASWGKEVYDTVTTSEKTYDADMNEKTTTRSSKQPKAKETVKNVGNLAKSKDGNYTFSR